MTEPTDAEIADVARKAEPAPAAATHIQQPYTLAEIKAKIASNDYSAELLLQHAMLLLDSLHADAAYLIGRLQLDTMDGARVVEIIRERIDAAKVALAAQQAAPVAQGDAPSDAELFPLIEKHFGMVPRRDDTVIDRRTGRFHDAQRYRDFAADLLSARAQPTPPAVVVPLTEEQRSDIATAAAGFNWTDDYVEAIDYVIDGVESLHSIKGGQHGAE